MGYFALIKDGVVRSVIVADQAFVDATGSVALGCDSVIEVAEESRPGPGYTYDGQTFSPPQGE